MECRTHYEVSTFIREMKVRGAPAIGIAAAYGMVLAVHNVIKMNGEDPKGWGDMFDLLDGAGEHLRQSRPTAVNLQWAVNRMLSCVKAISAKEFNKETLYNHLLRNANCIMEEDQKSCMAIGRFRAPRLSRTECRF